MSIIAIWLTSKQRIVCFPIGIVATLLTLELLFNKKLFADFGLYIIYFIMQIEGWYYWNKHAKTNFIPQKSTLKTNSIFLGLFLLIGITISLILENFTKATMPIVDSSLAVLSVIAQIYQNRKLIENWILWIISDISYAFLYFTLDMPVFSLLFLIYALIAFLSYVNWNKQIKEAQL